MKILLISNMYPDKKNPSYGTFVRNFVNQMESLNYEIDLSVMYKSNKKIMSYILFYMRSVIKIVKNDYDVVYVHYISNSSIPVIFTRKRKPIIINVHGSDVVSQKLTQKIFAVCSYNLVKKSDLIVVPSKYYEELVKKKFKVKESKVFISPSGGIDTNIFYPERVKKNGDFVVGFIGRLEKDKECITLIKAFETLNIDNKKLIIVGNGSMEYQLKKYVENSLISNKVKFYDLKPQEELRYLFNKFDCFVFPSLRESLGLVGLEAMACGCILIGAANDGIKTYVEDKVNGFLFTPGDYDDLKNKLFEVSYLDENTKIRVIANGINKALDYEKENVAKKLDLKIKEMIDC